MEFNLKLFETNWLNSNWQSQFKVLDLENIVVKFNWIIIKASVMMFIPTAAFTSYRISNAI